MSQDGHRMLNKSRREQLNRFQDQDILNMKNTKNKEIE